MKRERLDVLLAQRGLTESRETAQRLIRAGQVRIKGVVADKPGHRWPTDADITLEGASPFVSRGGEKLEAALETFCITVAGRVCLDVGSSTGGFTDCLLQHGAARVYAVDVGRGQLHWKLRNDSRVRVLEGINARHLTPADIGESVDLATADVSFISLTLILPAVIAVLRPGGDLVTLIKPQFEAGREQVGRGGVVRDAAVRDEVVARVREFGAQRLGLVWRGVRESPLRGPAGNVEFLAWWVRS